MVGLQPKTVPGMCVIYQALHAEKTSPTIIWPDRGLQKRQVPLLSGQIEVMVTNVYYIMCCFIEYTKIFMSSDLTSELVLLGRMNEVCER